MPLASGGIQKQESPHGAGFLGGVPLMWEHGETCIWWWWDGARPYQPTIESTESKRSGLMRTNAIDRKACLHTLRPWTIKQVFRPD